ncbi:MAG: GNAT family N-acetyltransferase [Chloroflexi bacterium]|nr:GNAT family N-acetyltransferase [Chloroflexota bacterium]
MRIDGPLANQACRVMPVLRALPDWFGIEKALLNYECTIDDLPTFVAHGSDGVGGFLSVTRHFARSAEIYVMGVAPERRRQGIGRRLLESAEAWLRDEGVTMLHVKTLGPSRPSAAYRQTRAFYEAMGFVPIEEFSTLWNEENPAPLFVKQL